MNHPIYTVINGTGSYLPKRIIKNDYFKEHQFFESNGQPISKSNKEIIDKFEEITTISERRYVSDDLKTSDIAFFAGQKAIESAKIDKEDLDYVIVAHNFGDTTPNNRQLDMLPSLASKVKHKLQIKNPNTIAYDVPFGCPGWVQAVIQANYYIKSGDAKKILVIGAEVLSRVYDPYDRDGMIYADGAGAVILEAKQSETPIGILAHKTRSDTYSHSQLLFMGASYNKDPKLENQHFLKMHGRKLYQYALETVPKTVKECLDNSGLKLEAVNKLLIHQANGKMDEAILQRLFKLYGVEQIPEDIMPMTISKLGNSSVASVPTLLDLILKGALAPHKITKGDHLVFASVGAGMNINAFIYKV
jgi:3-oxoacyl-[acyl-carrier-protein] synthase-3